MNQWLFRNRPALRRGRRTATSRLEALEDRVVPVLDQGFDPTGIGNLSAGFGSINTN
jgi:hypothetical protein